MADQPIGELIRATSISPTDLFVFEQSGVAKSLPGQILMNWMVSYADGHGGIQSIVKKGSSGLVDTYRITLSDTTFYDITVTNGKGIVSISKTKTEGLVDTYTITYNDGPATTFTVTNGAKGDKGDNAYVWIKYASQEPTEASHSMSDLPDKWMGVYSGGAATAPADWTQYNWYEIKGATGDTGAASTIISNVTEYLASSSGTIVPSGSWTVDIPAVPQGMYLWTRVTATFNSGSPVVSYSVSRMGKDGLGSVVTVNGVSADSDGNVQLTADDIGAVPLDGTSAMTGNLNMGGNTVAGLGTPTNSSDAVPKSYVDPIKTTADHALPKSGGTMTAPLHMGGNRITDLGTPTTNTDAASVGWVNKNVWAQIYKVGAIYQSADPTSPASLFGGTWEMITNRFLLAAGDLYAAGATGGEAEHTLDVDEIPAHTHLLDIYTESGSASGGTLGWGSGKGGSRFGTSGSGGNQPHNNMPPYYAVYMWQRVA